MIIHRNEKFFVADEKRISMNKSFDNGISLYSDVLILGDKFVEYQKDLFTEFLSMIMETLSSEEEMTLKQFQRFFETKLQDLNSKLNLFSNKIKDVERMPVKGVVQIFYQNNFLASVIGDVSVVIFRENKLSHMMDNDVGEDVKIDVFSELIEGELEGDDNILVFGNNISTIMEDSDVEEMMEISLQEEKNLIDVVEDIVTTRISREDLGFLTLSLVEAEELRAFKKSKEKFFEKIRIFEDFKTFVVRFRYPIVILIGLGAIFFLVYFLIDSFMKGDEQNIAVIEDGVVVSDFSREELLKEINDFKKTDPSLPEKAERYKAIMEKINVLEEKGKWPYDIADYKKILNEEYYKGFNIYLMNKIDDPNLSQVFGFNEIEQRAMGDLKRIYYSNKFLIAGEKGALIGTISDAARGKLVEYNIPTAVHDCSVNIIADGMYCFSKDGEIFNIVKSGLQSVTTKSGKFPSNLEDVGTFNKNRFYVLSSDPNLIKEGSHIVRYVNTLGSQIKFGEGTKYTLKEADIENYSSALSSGFSSFAIDGTFLMWSKSDKALFQYKSDNQSFRKVDLVGGVDILDAYSSNVDVYSNESTKYVYLFDKQNQTYTVYRSAPYKDNTKYITSYKLIYFFRLKFDFGDIDVLDTFVDTGTKPILYILTKDGIYKIKLYEFFETVSDQ